jgi:hypothetical protein
MLELEKVLGLLKIQVFGQEYTSVTGRLKTSYGILTDVKLAR